MILEKNPWILKGFFVKISPLRHFEGGLSGLRQFLTIESSLKVTKNVFYFYLKAAFALKILKQLFLQFGPV